MSETLTDRISSRLKALNLSAQKASLRVSTNRDFFRNVLRAGAKANPKRETLSLIAQALDTSEVWLLTGTHPESASDVVAAQVQSPHHSEMPRDIPLMGTVAAAMGTTGAFELTSDTIDYVTRPTGIANAKDVYALYVTGESMVPRFHPGDLIFVSPHKPIMAQDIVVIQEANSNNGCPQAFIKLFLRRTETSIFTRQYNPDSTIEFALKPGTVMHKVLTTNELHGI